jgi:hypothetical protein
MSKIIYCSSIYGYFVSSINPENMEQNKKISSRKKFLLWGAGVFSSLTVLHFFSVRKKEKKKTVKMLTQDGKLVEVDAEKIYGSKRRRISDDQLKNWVNNKQS